MTQRLTKSDFMSYLHCPKSLWLSRHKPGAIPSAPTSAHTQMIFDQGYEIEAAIDAWLIRLGYVSQVVFEHPDGAYVRSDLVRHHDDGSLDLVEVKGGLSAKDEHLHDLGFQANVAQMLGHKIRSMQVAHLNPDHRMGNTSPQFVLTDVTDQVRPLIPDIKNQTKLALELLNQSQIDENGCTCLALSQGNHCASFAYFNPDVPDPSIYTLPNMRQPRIAGFVESGRFDLDQIQMDEVSTSQKKVLHAFQTKQPFVDLDYINAFIADMTYPLYFYDYEAYATPMPTLQGTKPYQQIPFQFSLHVLDADGRLTHHEYLAQDWELPAGLIEALQQVIGPSGTLVSWHKSYENKRNEEMADLYPQYAAFLDDITQRTVDLEDIFKHGYVEAGFNGSSSIKYVLPTLAPDLTYDDLAVNNGTAAMVAFADMLDMPQGSDRDKLRTELLNYCKLDSLAMVRLFQEITQIQGVKISL